MARIMGYMVSVSFIGQGNRSTWDNSTYLLQVSDTLYHLKFAKAG